MERNELGSCEVKYAEVGGVLVAFATGSEGMVWTASRSYKGLLDAVLQAVRGEQGDWSESAIGVSIHSEAAAIKHLQRLEDWARQDRNIDAGLCHCGHELFGSDHCPLCGCEECETTCDTRYHDSPNGRRDCDCPYHA